MEDTLDVWEIPAESATRVGHPAPFPVELPSRLIDLYTYRGDLVLDPFAGVGTTAVAAVRSGRRYAGYDLDESYIRLAEARVFDERQRLAALDCHAAAGTAGDLHSEAIRQGRSAPDLARSAIEAARFTDVRANQRQPGGIEVAYSARDRSGRTWFFEVTGGFTSHRPGLQRSDVLWKALGRAAVLQQVGVAPLVLLTTGLPVARSPAAIALQQVTGPGKPLRAVVDVTSRSGLGGLYVLGSSDF